MATAALSRPSGPVLSIPNYHSSSPNRVKLAAAAGARSPGKSVSVSSPSAARSRQSCMCSPTNHPGSFRCSKHKERKQDAPACHGNGHSMPASPPSVASLGSGATKLGTKRVGGSVESGTWARRALAGFVLGPVASPPSHSQGTAPATTTSEQTNQTSVDMP